MAVVRIPVEKLPPPDKNGNHFFQFRIISVDKNQWSAWSQLYEIKSIGQYMPQESDVTLIVSSDDVTVAWDTPTVYNVNAQLDESLYITHNHSQNFKQHDTDVFVKWTSGSVTGPFEYHGRVSTDSTSIIIPDGATQVRVVGLVALKDIPKRNTFEDITDYQNRLDSYLAQLPDSVILTFKIFDTDTQSLT